MADNTLLVQLFNTYITTRFPNLIYNPALETKDFTSQLQMDKKMVVYRDNRVTISALKRQTWCQDDLDIFIKLEFVVDGKLIFVMKDFF